MVLELAVRTPKPAIFLVVIAMVGILPAKGQIDPQVGRRLSKLATEEEQQVQMLSSRLAAFNARQGHSRIYDLQLLSASMYECHRLMGRVQNEIYSLNYDEAAKDVEKLQDLVKATRTILDEDEMIAPTRLEQESVLDENYAPVEQIPTLRGAALRAAIASELSFTERLLAKALFSGPSIGVLPTHGPDATPCSDERGRLIEEEAEMEKNLGYSAPGDSAERKFFSMAYSELGLLHYTAAHEIASKTYAEGQRILSICSTDYGKSNPSSIIAMPNGSPIESNGTTPATPAPKPKETSDIPSENDPWQVFRPVERARISAAAAAELLVEKTEPLYPPLAQAAQVSGTVFLDVFISEAGDVQDVHVISGPAMLDDSAVAAVKKWHYKPYLANGRPVPIETTVKVTFSLGGSGK